MDKKSIAIIIQKLNGGGAERTASNLSLFFCEKYDVHLIVFDGREIKYPYEGTLHDLKLYPAGNKIGQISTLFRRARAVKKIKRECKVVASISLMDGANVVNVLSSTGEKIITSVRIQMSKSRFKSGLKKIINKKKMTWIGKRSEYVVALSQGVNDDLVNNFGINKEKVVTIYNPCDGEMLKKKAEVHQKDAKQMVDLCITTMGRFTEQKGQWHLIRAFSEVVKELPEAKLYILGDGPLEEKLKTLTKDLGLEDNVVFLGFVEAPHAYIMNSKAFVFPSLFEGLGNVLLEAMACGTPCIATDCYSGPREIIAPGTKVVEQLDKIEEGAYGILTSVGKEVIFSATEPITIDEEQLAIAIKKVLTNEEYRKELSELSIKRSKDFLPDVVTEQWNALF